MTIDVEYLPVNGAGYTVKRGQYKGMAFESKAAFEAWSREQTKQAPKDVAPDGVQLDKPRSLRKQIGVLISGINDVLLAVPITHDDALAQEEADRLVSALDQAQQSSARIRKYVLAGTEGAGVLPLVFVGISIILTRLMKHGLIPGLPQPGQMTREQFEAAVAQAREQFESQQRATQQTGSYPLDQEPLVPPIYAGAGA